MSNTLVFRLKVAKLPRRYSFYTHQVLLHPLESLLAYSFTLKSPVVRIITYLEYESLVSSLEKLFKFHFCSLLGVQESQHQQIHAPHELFIPVVLHSRFAETVVVDEDARSRFESWDEVLQNCYSVFSGEVVQDPTEIIDCLLSAHILNQWVMLGCIVPSAPLTGCSVKKSWA